MDKKELINKMKETKSVMDFYELKPEMLRHLGADSSPERVARKKVLSDMKMSEVREIGNALGTKDTSKSELIEEILDKEGL